MRAIHVMLIDQDNARRFAARVVRSMIRLGCDAATMRRHEIPTSVFYGVFGGGRHRGGYAPDDVARENMRQYRKDYLYNKDLRGGEAVPSKSSLASGL